MSVCEGKTGTTDFTAFGRGWFERSERRWNMAESLLFTPSQPFQDREEPGRALRLVPLAFRTDSFAWLGGTDLSVRVVPTKRRHRGTKEKTSNNFGLISSGNAC